MNETGIVNDNEKIKQDPVVKKFKSYLEELHIPLVSIYLFGSRSRGNERIDSDYDILILLENELQNDNIKILTRKIVRNIHKIIPDASFDILIKKIEEFEYYKKEVNTICHTIYEEGVLI